MTQPLPVQKTLKLFIDGKFPRSESGRTRPVRRGSDVYASVASRKDLRDAMKAANTAQHKWAAATPYLRGQIVYRLAEMLEARAAEITRAIEEAGGVDPASEARAAIDRLVSLAGWSDKVAQVFGNANAVSGPYHNFSVPQPVGATVLLVPEHAAVPAMLTLIGASLSCGCACVVICPVGSAAAAVAIAEAVATSDVPAGVVNILTGDAEELGGWIAEHRDVAAVVAADPEDDLARRLRSGTAENFKRVARLASQGAGWLDHDRWSAPETLEAFLEIKTLWHPSSV